MVCAWAAKPLGLMYHVVGHDGNRRKLSRRARPTEQTMMSIDEFGGNPLRSLPPTSSIRQKKIEQNGKKQHKKTAIALVDLAT